MLTKLVKARIFDIEASGKCNVKCKFCPREVLPKMDFMSEETFRSFIEKVPKSALGCVSFIGIGEPLMNPLLPKFIKMAKERKPSVYTSVTTNGTLLTEARVNELLETGVSHIEVSFNGLEKEVFEEHMKGAKFDEVLSNVKNAVQIIKESNKNTKLLISFVVTNENADKVDDIKKFWNEIGIKEFRILRMHDRSGLLDDKSKLIKDTPGIIDGKCDMFDFFNFVAWNGDMHYCCHDMRRAHKLGNINTNSWKEIEAKKQEVRDKQIWPKMCRECTEEWRYSMRKGFNPINRLKHNAKFMELTRKVKKVFGNDEKIS